MIENGIKSVYKSILAVEQVFRQSETTQMRGFTLQKDRT